MINMKEKLKNLFYKWAYLDTTGEYKKENTYFYRFPQEIAKNNQCMMRSMSGFILIICIFVIGSTYTYFGAPRLRGIYLIIAILELGLFFIAHVNLHRDFSSKTCTILTSLHLFHMFLISGYIGVFYSLEETALVFLVVLTISAMIFTLPPMLTTCISIICTLAVIITSYHVKASYWFESDVLNGVAVLIFSILLGFRINQIRAEEAFARADSIRLNEELKKISITDPLTGIYNHRSFQNNYYEMFKRAKDNGLALGVAMMDIDNFKSFNDMYGHVAGDACLSRVAGAIVTAVPKGAIVCRYGGEEFVALFDENLCDSAATVGEDIRKSILKLKIPHKHKASATGVVTLSVGTYIGVPREEEEPMSFVERADKAMYQSKAEGRNRCTVLS